MNNAVDSLCNGSFSGRRAQTVYTPDAILNPVRRLFAGSSGHLVTGDEIVLDPVWAPGSLTTPQRAHVAPWPQVWARVAELAAQELPQYTPLIEQLISSQLRAKDIKDSALRGRVSKLAIKIRKQVAKEFEARSGHAIEWPAKTFVNPPFGDKGPEVVLATFADFCAAFAAAENECVFLGPARPHRKWWRRDVMLSATALVYLNSVKFHGFAQTFPAPLCLAYKSGKTGSVELLAQCCGHLGEVVKHERV